MEWKEIEMLQHEMLLRGFNGWKCPVYLYPLTYADALSVALDMQAGFTFLEALAALEPFETV